MKKSVARWTMRIIGAAIYAMLFYVTEKVSGETIPYWGWVLIITVGGVHFSSEEIRFEE